MGVSEDLAVRVCKRHNQPLEVDERGRVHGSVHCSSSRDAFRSER